MKKWRYTRPLLENELIKKKLEITDKTGSCRIGEIPEKYLKKKMYYAGGPHFKNIKVFFINFEFTCKNAILFYT